MKFTANRTVTVGGKVMQGFSMTFNNGLTASVSFGDVNWCDGGKNTAEVSVWDENGKPVTVPGLFDEDTVGHMSPDDVAFFLASVATVEHR